MDHFRHVVSFRRQRANQEFRARRFGTRCAARSGDMSCLLGVAGRRQAVM